MRVGLVSAKGAPGVTTVAASFAAVSGGVLVEADPSGGSVEYAVSMGEPGLIGLASALRHAGEPGDVFEACVVTVRGGLRAVAAPTNGTTAESALVAIGERFDQVLVGFDGLVVMDVGRWSPGQPTARRLAGCDVVAVVCSPTVASVGAARAIVAPLAQMFGVSVRAVMVGDRPFGVAEVEAAVGASVAGVVAWERRSIETLWANGATKAWMRSGLARSATAVLAALQAAVLPPLEASYG